MVKIEEGKFYKTRGGRKVGPMVWDDATSVWRNGPDFVRDGGYYWHKEGSWYGHCEDELDIISEWQDETPTQGPIREVRRREIVDGEYGGIHIRKYDPDHLNVSFDRSLFTSEQLREASHLFAQLAEAMEERANDK